MDTADLDTENQVCSLAILGQARFLESDNAQKIEPKHFHSDFHRRVFETVSDMVEANEHVTPRRVKQRLGVTDSQLSKWIPIVESAATLAHADHYSVKLRKEWLAREIYKICDSHSKTILSEENPSEIGSRLVDQISQKLFEVDGISDDGFRTGKDGALEVLGYLQELSQDKGVLGMPMGIPGMDRIVRLTPGSLNVIAARPSKGKSALAMQVLMSIGDRENVALFSLEMIFREIGLRYLMAETSISSDQIIEGKPLSKSQQTEASVALSKMGSKRIFVRDNPVLTDSRLQFWMRSLAKRDVKVIVIDYLSLISTPRKTDRRIELGDITRSLKRMAKEYNMAVILLSQLNRDADKCKPEDMSLSHLAETDDIARDASVVIMIGSDENIYIKKNRNGPTGRIISAFDAPNQTFRVFSSEDEKESFVSRTRNDISRSERDEW